jgi:hypothetical protein
MQLAMADQLHNNGMTDKAVARADQAQASKSKALELYAGVAGDTAKMHAQLANTKLGRDAAIYAAELGYKGNLATAAATRSKPSTQMEGVAIKAREIKRKFPDMPDEQVMDEALTAYNFQTKTGLGGVDARNIASARDKAAEDTKESIQTGIHRKEYKKLEKEGTPEQLAAFRLKIFNEHFQIRSDEASSTPGAAQPAPNAPAQQPAPAAQASPADQQAMLWANDPKNANDPRLPAIKARLGLK